MRIAITGATGYIGTRLAALATAQGCEIFFLTRNPPDASREKWIAYNLYDTDELALPKNTQAVVHLAFNPRLETQADADAEIAAAVRILNAAESIGARFVFVSSQTARQDAPTLYGLTKWHIEQIVLQRGGKVVRPGQVYGGPEMGLFGILVKTVHRFPLLPAFLPQPLIQPVHVDDLAAALLRIACASTSPMSIYSIAQVEPVSFTAFLKAIAGYRLLKTRFYLPVPTLFVRLVTKLVGQGGPLGSMLRRLESLFDLPQMDSRESLTSLGLQLRSMQIGMQPDFDAHQRVRDEAVAMLQYVLNRRPDGILIQRYVDAIAQFRNGRALGLPRFAIRHPSLLALLDDPAFVRSERGSEFAWRLDAATLLAEASQIGAARFAGINQSAGFFRYGLQLASSVIVEVLWRIARRISLPLFLRNAMKRSFP
jgi:NADH dehydrogenase